jgi:ribosomal protein S18 acetylase RimI-like enzyme
MRLRPATIRDDSFCFALHEASMREYVEPVYGWDADVQRAFHDEWFDPDRLSIVEDDAGRPVGVLEVSDEGDHLYLSRIELLPDAQGRGLGTAVVGELLRGRMVRLRVFANNVRARAFYERLGFTVVSDDEREGRLSMRHPGAARDEP